MSVLDLAAAKLYLNITNSASDAELPAFIDAAEAAIAQRVGPLSTTSATNRVPGFGWNLHLPVYPAVSLTSVTVVGSVTPLTLADLYLEKNTGAVSYNSGAFFSSPAYDVVYTVGRSSVPADLIMAVRELLRHLWTTQRGGAVRPGQGGGSDQITFAAQVGALPARVVELIAPYLLLPGLA